MNNTYMKVRLIAALMAGGLLASALGAPAPVEVLFGPWDQSAVRLSPDGKKLATIFTYGDDNWQTGLALVDIATKQAQPVIKQHDAIVYNFGWVGGDRLIVTLLGHWWRTGMVSFDASGKNLREVVPLSLIDYSDRRMLLRGTRIIHVDREQQTVLAARSLRFWRQKQAPYLYGGMDPAPSVYRIDLRTGEFTVVAKDPGRTMEWVADPAGKVRLAWGYAAEAFKADGKVADPKAVPGKRAYWFDDDGQSTVIEGITGSAKDEAQPLGFESGGRRLLFVSRRGADRAAVYAYDPATRTVEGPVVASDEVEISDDDALYSPHDSGVVAVMVREGRPRVAWLDPQLKALAKEIDEALPEFVNTFMDWSPDLKRVLIRSTSTIEPGRYYLFDREAGTLEEVVSRSRELRKHPLAEMKPVVVTARDGEKLHGFLALPKEAPKGRPLSMIVMVHGGPWERDTARFDPVLQFFTTRGYSVLTVNFRGSTGYGRRFEELGNRQLGTGMIHDVLDAAEWAVREGHAARDRIAIGGASYGGYAALRALTLEPDRFKTGISLLPVADVARQISDYKRRDQWLPYFYWTDRVGDPDKEADRAALKEISPVYHFARLKAPVFVAFGDRDEVIDYRHSTEIINQLRAHKKNFSYIEAKYAGHSLGDSQMQMKVFREIEKFLAKNFPP